MLVLVLGVMEDVAMLLMVEIVGGLKSSTELLDVNPAGRFNEVDVADGGSTLSILIEDVDEGAAGPVAVELGDAVVKDMLCEASAHGQATML